MHENRVDADRGGIVEWYVNDPRGLEQGFTIAARPEGEGTLVEVELTLTGTLNPRLSEDGRAIDFVAPNGDRALHYAELVVTDARGKALPAWFEGFAADRRRGIRIVVDDADAAYPMTIDPLATSPAWAMSVGPAGNFGYAVAAAGDVNGDGYGDVIVGAPNYDMGGTDEGCAYVFHGNATGLDMIPRRIANGAGAGANAGFSVATAGDVNGDGFSDVVVGAPGWASKWGRAIVFRGSSMGVIPSPWWTEIGNTNWQLGYTVAPAGDVNGDGFSDIVVGAPGYTYDHFHEGAVFVYDGSATGLPYPPAPSWIAMSHTPRDPGQETFGAAAGTAGDVNGDGYSDIVVGDSYSSKVYVWHGSATGLGPTGEPDNADWSARPKTSAGAAVGTAGDVNGDGFTDVIVGAPRGTVTFAEEGQVMVFAGSTTGLGAAALWTRVGGQANAHYGWSVGTAGDVNGDNYADIVVGAPNYTWTYAEGGKAEVFHGSASGPSASPDWSVAGAAEADHYGWAVATAGDVNGDGFSDVLAGAPDHSEGLGRAEAFLGGPAGLASARIWDNEGDQAGAQFGYSVASAGDVNGDGYSEIIVGAVLFDDGQTNEGKVFVYDGSDNGPSSVPDWTATSNNAEARMGYSVASAGDVNGDGYDDVVVGARGYSEPETDEGAVFVWHGSSTGLGATGVPSNADWSAQSNQASAYFGIAVSSAGDVNGDGYSDVDRRGDAVRRRPDRRGRGLRVVRRQRRARKDGDARQRRLAVAEQPGECALRWCRRLRRRRRRRRDRRRDRRRLRLRQWPDERGEGFRVVRLARGPRSGRNSHERGLERGGRSDRCVLRVLGGRRGRRGPRHVRRRRRRGLSLGQRDRHRCGQGRRVPRQRGRPRRHAVVGGPGDRVGRALRLRRGLGRRRERRRLRGRDRGRAVPRRGGDGPGPRPGLRGQRRGPANGGLVDQGRFDGRRLVRAERRFGRRRERRRLRRRHHRRSGRGRAGLRRGPGPRLPRQPRRCAFVHPPAASGRQRQAGRAARFLRPGRRVPDHGARPAAARPRRRGARV